MKIIFSGFNIVTADGCFYGSVITENNIITEVINGKAVIQDAAVIINGNAFSPSAVLMPAFIDLHAHFRDPFLYENGTPFPAETLESACLAAAAGGFTTVIGMANTKPVTDTIAAARRIKARCDALGLIDLYPVLPLTKNMEGRELSEIAALPAAGTDKNFRLPLMLSEDGRDVINDDLFLAAMKEAKRLGLPVSCHCDFGGAEAQAAKDSGQPRSVWSRIEENNAVRRAIELGKKAGCHVHIAHVSTAESVDTIRRAKQEQAGGGFVLTCEATPHHIGATEDTARRMGGETYGRVNPPLRTEADRLAVTATLFDGTIDAVATDHAPHSAADKASGAPGFSGLETAFAAVFSGIINITNKSFTNKNQTELLSLLSTLMSRNPARILGLNDRGTIAPGLRADLVIIDTEKTQTVNPEHFLSRGKCTPFAGTELKGTVIMTVNAGRIVYTGG